MSERFLQQGRVLTDEDLNAHRRLDAEDERLTFRDIICAKGTPNHGFRIEDLTTRRDRRPDRHRF